MTYLYKCNVCNKVIEKSMPMSMATKSIICDCGNVAYQDFKSKFKSVKQKTSIVFRSGEELHDYSDSVNLDNTSLANEVL